MASNIKTVHLYVTSFHGDFVSEREILFKEVIPDIRAWCESRKLLLVETDFRWGGQSSPEISESIQKQIEQHYYVEEMPIFINITCDTLGLVPIWGHAHEGVAKAVHTKLHISEIELGILYGAYREDNTNALFVVRNDDFMDDLLPEEEKHFFNRRHFSSEEASYCKNLLCKVKPEKMMKFRYNCAGWDPGVNKLITEIEETFAKMVLDKLKYFVSRSYPLDHSSLDPYTLVRDSHEAFMSTRNLKVKGREDLVKKIDNYIYSGERDVPLLLLGGAGSGKSSIMAKATDHIVAEASSNNIPCHGDDRWLVFYHFVGAVPGSTELESMLRRLLKELDIVNESSMPKDLESCAQLCYGALSNPNTRPTIVMVDAVNQFDEDPAAMIMSWVPRKLAPQIRVVLSMINDSTQHETLSKRESKPQELHLTPLDIESRRQIVVEMLGQYNKVLSRDQMNSLLSKRASENPLWLSIACEELRLTRDTRQLVKRTESLPDGLLDLLEEILERFEGESGGQLKVATLCLLEASTSGLLETELLAILGNEKDLVPPSPYDEKEEKEDTEKESRGEKEKGPLSVDKWAQVYRSLRPFLRPYGDSHEGRLDFYHRALSKAVRRKYFKKGEENEGREESQDIYKFWHQKLADFFEKCDNVDRRAEEYLYHLSRVNDKSRLLLCLVDWDMFDKLYNEEYSSQLLSYWRQAGGTLEMITQYKMSLADLESTEARNEQLIALRHEHVARIFLQAGKYNESLELTKVALKWEEKELGNRPERMVELYGLMAEIYDEKLKLNDFVSPTQLPDLRKTICYGRKSISLRKLFDGNYHKFKLGMSLMKLAFSLESWEACGGDGELTGDEALREGNGHIDTALQIFKELKDTGHYAEALMTKGVLAPRGSMEQLKHYKEAMEMCMQVYGEYSLLTSRLYINIGIVYEDNNDYVKAYEYFKKWAKVSEIVLGPDHPKTMRAKGVLKEPRYRLVAQRLKERRNSDAQTNEGQNNENTDEESAINAEVEEMNDTEDGYHVDGLVNDCPEVEQEEQEEEINDSVEGDFVAVTDELQQAINELLRRALGGLESDEMPQSTYDPLRANQGNNQSSTSNRSNQSNVDVSFNRPLEQRNSQSNDSESDSVSGEVENGYSSSSSLSERFDQTHMGIIEADNRDRPSAGNETACNVALPNNSQPDSAPNGRPPQSHIRYAHPSTRSVRNRRSSPLDTANSPLRNLLLGNDISIVDSNRGTSENWPTTRDNRLTESISRISRQPSQVPSGRANQSLEENLPPPSSGQTLFTNLPSRVESPSLNQYNLLQGADNRHGSNLFSLTVEELNQMEELNPLERTESRHQSRHTSNVSNESRQQQQRRQRHHSSDNNARTPTSERDLGDSTSGDNEIASFRELVQRALSLDISRALDEGRNQPQRDNREGYDSNRENGD